jgi:hypothetical protein
MGEMRRDLRRDFQEQIIGENGPSLDTFSALSRSWPSSPFRRLTKAHKKFPIYTYASAVTLLLSRAYAKTMTSRNAGTWRRSDPHG